jgi:hypothetical protein
MKRLRINASKFRTDQRGAASVEFVIIFPVLFFLVGFIFLLAIDFFWLLTSQKAVERGAREAIVRLPVADALVEQGRIVNYASIGNVRAGAACQPTGVCQEIATFTCRGGEFLNADPAASCDQSRFQTIYDVVVQLAPDNIQPRDLSITYQDSGLGRTSESYIPLVTVQLEHTRVLRAFAWIDDFFAVGGPTTSIVAASLVGEHLGN